MSRTAGNGNDAHTLSALIALGRQQMAGSAHQAPGMQEPHAYRSRVPAITGTIRLQELLPSFPKKTDLDEITYPAPIVAKYAGKRVTLATSILEASRVAEAGAQIIPVSTPPTLAVGAVPALYQQKATFSIITAALFGASSDDSELPISVYPAARASIDIGSAPTHAVRFEFGRSAQKAVADDVLTFEAMHALTLGIARLADTLLLEAIAASTPAVFSLAAAAAKGLKFGELRALVGASGAGAAVGQDGVLRATGISAELTDTVPGTYIGAFNRAGVTVCEDITLLVERLGVAGKVAVTAFVDMHALLPDPDAFWVA